MRKLFLLEDDLSLISGLTLCIQETGFCTGYSPDAGRSRGAVVRQKI